jgi:hypothetical protein
MKTWFDNKWRPASAWLYLLICLFDFIIAPVLWSIMQVLINSTITTQWQPLTLMGGGLLHVSFGAIMGITSFGRTQEKLAGKD